ncbi:helix-turn-helix transcriptional regulator [Pelobacter propionicus]|uniref:helix-turn-helix transcriptional regulator n=1 Tax=Pelobacter propionicus TaxID=29543 RepID=UPI000A03498C
MIMKRQDVVRATGLCYTTIYNMEKAGQFPARRQLAAGRVGWLRTEVQAWADGLLAVVR